MQRPLNVRYKLVLRPVQIPVSTFRLILTLDYSLVSFNFNKGILLFPEDESGESSQQEEEESEAGETDEPDTEDYTLTDEQLERRR